MMEEEGDQYKVHFYHQLSKKEKIGTEVETELTRNPKSRRSTSMTGKSNDTYFLLGPR